MKKKDSYPVTVLNKKIKIPLVFDDAAFSEEYIELEKFRIEEEEESEDDESEFDDDEP